MAQFSSYIPLLARGLLITLAAWFIAGALSLCIGMCIGIVGARRFVAAPLAFVLRVYTFVAKGIPAYVQILIAYFALPALLGINVSGFVAAVGALAFCSSGYVAEIIRSGINAIPAGQWDACFALGYSRSQTLSRIIIPQVLRNSFQSLSGEFEQLLKSTSLLATIGVSELTRSGINIISRELNPIPVYCTIACLYLAISALLNVLTFYVEEKIYGSR
jgi:His/Glu/Gln/Arg/opine family amino acid ABC transporter permease subunit